jgi:hypothetical protein
MRRGHISDRSVKCHSKCVVSIGLATSAALEGITATPGAPMVGLFDMELILDLNRASAVPRKEATRTDLEIQIRIRGGSGKGP